MQLQTKARNWFCRKQCQSFFLYCFRFSPKGLRFSNFCRWKLLIQPLILAMSKKVLIYSRRNQSRKSNTMWYWWVNIKKKKREKRQQSRKDHFQRLTVWESFDRIAFNLINVLIPLNVSRLLGCHQSHNHHWKLGQQDAICWNYLGLRLIFFQE